MKNWKKLVVGEKTAVRDVIQVINAAAAQIALVVDDGNHLLGTVTDGDVRRGLLKGVTIDATADDIMSRNYISASVKDSRDDVFSLMRNKRIRQVPVVDVEGNVRGIHLLDEMLQIQLKDNAVVIMAGGKGNRLHPLTLDCPKPMLKVGGKPILRLIIDNLARQGFRNIHISINFLGDRIKTYFANDMPSDVNISYIEETKELGTAGAVSLINEIPSEPFMVMNGDVLTQVDYSGLLNFHMDLGAKATVCVRPHEYEIPYGVAAIEGDNLVGLEEKPIKSHLVNAGIYVFEPDVLKYFTPGEKVDMPVVLQRLIDDRHNLVAYPIHEYWLDIGHHESYAKANADVTDE